ncbi:MAG: hypothetical protein IJX37_07615 [Oscillospiraceae bacterium]|nr:hypothetical protein [Oscillospiraceae bacterium]
MKKTVLSTVFSSILSLFLALALLAVGLCIYAANTVCTPSLLTDLAKSSGYCQELYAQIQYDWENLLAITGVADPAPIMAVLTPELVESDAIAYISDSYSGSAKLDTEALEKALDEKVRAYVLTILPDGTIDEELEKNIDELVTACINDYKSAIRIPALPKILGTVAKLEKYLTVGFWAAAGVAVVLLVFLFFLQQKRQDTLYYTAIATGTNTVIFLTATGLAAHYKIVDRLPIDVSALKTLLTAYLQELLSILQKYGQFFLLATVLLLLVYLLAVAINLKLQKKEN